MKLLILDTETTGFLPQTCELLEIGWAMYETGPFGGHVHGGWQVVQACAGENAARDVNHIPMELVHLHGERPGWDELHARVRQCDALVSHNAQFDAQWVPSWVTAGRPWVCTVRDWPWPDAAGESRGLASIARSLGAAAPRAHRAIEDVLTLVSCFEQLRFRGFDLDATAQEAIAHACARRVVLVVPPLTKGEGLTVPPSARRLSTRENGTPSPAVLGFHRSGPDQPWRLELAEPAARRVMTRCADLHFDVRVEEVPR